MIGDVIVGGMLRHVSQLASERLNSSFQPRFHISMSSRSIGRTIIARNRFVNYICVAGLVCGKASDTCEVQGIEIEC